jgi:hypothetical protein
VPGLFLGVFLQPGLTYNSEVLVVPVSDFDGKGRPRVCRIREQEVRFARPPIDSEGYVGDIKYEFPLSGRSNLPEIEPEELNDDAEEVPQEGTPLQGGNVLEPIIEEIEADPPADGDVGLASSVVPKRRIIEWDVEPTEQETSEEKKSAAEQQPPFQGGEGSSSSSSRVLQAP